uniref:Soluble scavenger receptor cysteine-rich domain-containing protein SSC5D n=1 Tax=Neogobius melanostomus TaxID=47308 RepID=A0A8C6SDF2_9GOBI
SPSLVCLLLVSCMRLVAGGNNCSGRVEVFHSGQWGTVCGNSWDINDAKVVCRQLGCGNAVAVSNYGMFGQGSGSIWMDDVRCSGNEASIFECSHNGFGAHYCGHSEDAGVLCEGCSLRLVSGNNSCSGRVEVFAAGYWGTVCGNSWDINDATVVCRQAGCGDAVAVARNAQFGQGSGLIWMDNVHCSRNETSLFECSHNGLGGHYCSHYEDSGVICEVRLVSGINNCSGRVEVFAAGYWGQLVCRQAGCGDAVAVARNAQFGQGSGIIWMDNVHCSGNETSVFECSHNGLGDHYCGHYYDAGVICEVRLVSGINNCSGIVEVFAAGYWGTVLVCRQAGCGDAVAVARSAQFGQGSGFIWMDNVRCSGNETSVFECSHNGLGAHYCGHYQDAGVICEVRLVSGINSCSGRVEVFAAGYWGTVCHNSWDINDATVVCRQAGCGDAVAVARSAQFGQGSGFIWMDNVHCSGNETSVFECSHNGLGAHYCGHFYDAGVICEGMFL